MALSQDEQRILAEIERRLASDDPGLATSLTAFRRPGPAKMLRSPRVRIVGSLFTVLLVAMVSLTVYAMIPFRALHAKQAPATTTSTPAHTTAMAPATGTQPAAAHQSSASGRTAPTTGSQSAASSLATAKTSQVTASQNSTGRTSSSHTATSATAMSTSQRSATTAAIRDLIPTVNVKP